MTWSRNNEVVKRLRTIPGIGVVAASALAAYGAERPVDMMDKTDALSIISTGSTSAIGNDKQDFGSMIR